MSDFDKMKAHLRFVPPRDRQVDMAAVASVQSGFARNFPFQKHGQRFAEASARSAAKKLITSDGPARLIG